MALSQTPWSLATFAQGDQAVAALEVGGVAYRLTPSLARVGLAGQDSVLGLLSDWARSLTALNAAASQVQAADQITAASRLAPVLYPGKFCAPGPITSIIWLKWACQAPKKKTSACFSS